MINLLDGLLIRFFSISFFHFSIPISYLFRFSFCKQICTDFVFVYYYLFSLTLECNRQLECVLMRNTFSIVDYTICIALVGNNDVRYFEPNIFVNWYWDSSDLMLRTIRNKPLCINTITCSMKTNWNLIIL